MGGSQVLPTAAGGRSKPQSAREGGKGTEWVSSRTLTSAIGGKEGKRRRGENSQSFPVSSKPGPGQRPSRVKVNLSESCRICRMGELSEDVALDTQ